MITDESGQVVWKAGYDPFGEANVVVQLIENNFRFPGQHYDEETGLHQNYFREYAPGLGRYMIPDPSHNMPGNTPFLLRSLLLTPQELHEYTYAMNNVVNVADPHGLGWPDYLVKKAMKKAGRWLGKHIGGEREIAYPPEEKAMERDLDHDGVADYFDPDDDNDGIPDQDDPDTSVIEEAEQGHDLCRK